MNTFKKFASDNKKFFDENYCQDYSAASKLATLTNGVLEKLSEVITACDEYLDEIVKKNADCSNSFEDAKHKLILEIGDCLCYIGIVAETLEFNEHDYNLFIVSREDKNAFGNLNHRINQFNLVEQLNAYATKLIFSGLGIHKRLFRGDLEMFRLNYLYSDIFSLLNIYIGYCEVSLDTVYQANTDKRKESKKLTGTDSTR